MEDLLKELVRKLLYIEQAEHIFHILSVFI